MSRAPLRLRLALAFAAAMAVVLGAVAVVVHARLGATLVEQLDESLEARSVAIGATGSGGLEAAADDGVAQLLGQGGRVVASTGTRAPLLTAAEVVRARREAFFVTREALPALEGEPARLLARATNQGVLVVGASLEERDEALAGLRRELGLALPLALLAASAGAYLLAASALRPVEAMRRQAEAITSESTGQRLPVASNGDEIARLGATLNAMLDRLEDGLERERRFVADASHELRTPLQLLATELDLALRRPRDRSELEAAIHSAANETDRLVRLAEDLLVLATAERGRLPLRREEVDLDQVLETVARRFAHRVATAGRTLAVDADPLRVSADRLRLEQALGNLVDNALRHGRGAIRVEAAALDGTVQLRVTDEGRFPANHARSAFEPFTRGDEARSEGGAGLGLAIVDAVARAHGGTARVDEDASGTSVVVSLPAAG